MYVDHIAVFSRDKTRVDSAINRIISELSSCGLLTHEHTPAATQCDPLGMHIDGDRKEIHMTAKGYWIIRWASEWMPRRWKVRDRTLERIIGHTTFAALLNRNALSVTRTQCISLSANITSIHQFFGTVFVETLKPC